MPAVKGGTYGGVTAAGRRGERRRQLLEATLEVVGTEGWSATTVRAVCREAGLSPKYFYESFASVDELAVALFDEIFEWTTACVDAAIDAAPRHADLRTRVAVETFVGELTSDARVARFAFVEALACEPLTRRRLAAVRSTVEVVLAQTRPSPRRSGVADRYREVAATVLVGGLAELLVAWMHGEISADLPDVVDDYVRLVLQVGGSTRPARTPTSAGRTHP